MADAYMRASTELSVIVPEVWSQRFYDALLQDNPFESLVSKDWEGEIQNLGDTVRISTVPEFALATEDVEGVRTDAEAVTVGQQNLVIDKRLVKDFIITDNGMMQSLPAMDKLRDLAIFSIMKKVQALIIAATVPTGANAIAYDLGTTLALADMLEAKELLDAGDVPGSDRSMVVGAAQLNDIFNITGFTSSDFLVSGAPLQSGELPSALLGFSPNFTSAAGATSYFFHRSYLTMAGQQGIRVQEYDLGVDGIRGKRVNVDWLGGFKQLDDTRVVTIG
jgi:hypothetical protein